MCFKAGFWGILKAFVASAVLSFGPRMPSEG